MDKFKAIRPYFDTEVKDVIAKLIVNPELISLIADIRFPTVGRIAPPLANFLIKRHLKAKTKNIETVDDVQTLVAEYVRVNLQTSSRGVSVSGLDNLSPQQACLFIGNHRDITMDPAVLSYVLRQHGHSSTRIAIGDNLLERDFVGDLMRLNKSFLVKRNISKPRALLVALLQLSNYIRHSLVEEQHSVWLAQREGRAKDGWDQTDPAIIKMLVMSAGKQDSFQQAIDHLNIVPVSISYEYDPCDLLKAKELYIKNKQGDYEKSVNEDFDSIFLGINGEKGRIHLALGDVLQGDYENAQQVAKDLDQQIVMNYKLFPSNYFAFYTLNGYYPQNIEAENVFDPNEHQQEQALFEQRVASYPKEYAQHVLTAYANPIENKLQKIAAT